MTAGRDGDKRLVAWVEAGDQPALQQQLREHLADRLPRYMIPADLVRLDALPLNRNGKVDERALPAPGPPEPDSGFRAPAAGPEQLVAGIWSEVLGLQRVGVEDNFFDLGGHSLLLAEVQRALADRGHELPIVTFFEYPTIQRLARHLSAPVTAQNGDGFERAALRSAGRARLSRRRAAMRLADPAEGERPT